MQKVDSLDMTQACSLNVIVKWYCELIVVVSKMGSCMLVVLRTISYTHIFHRYKHTYLYICIHVAL